MKLHMLIIMSGIHSLIANVVVAHANGSRVGRAFSSINCVWVQKVKVTRHRNKCCVSLQTEHSIDSYCVHWLCWVFPVSDAAGFSVHGVLARWTCLGD